MKIYVGVTDNNWFQFLKSIQPDEVNFWQPKSNNNFRAINEGELFLFKLHAPYNYIVGGGVFVRQTFLQVSMTWDTFGIKNGTSNKEDFMKLIYKHRNTDRNIDFDPVISSIILSMPFFFEESEWIPVPNSWSQNIMRGKTYDTDTIEGRRLFDVVQNKIRLSTENLQRFNLYGEPQVITPRLGQGGFRVVITEAYQRRCAITGEKTLPVLEASHIRPYSEEGPHLASNGILLRQDYHTLFDRGYITINKKLNIEVSHKIKEDFGNGKEYYKHHGSKLFILPDRQDQRPDPMYLEWHNEKVYKG